MPSWQKGPRHRTLIAAEAVKFLLESNRNEPFLPRGRVQRAALSAPEEEHVLTPYRETSRPSRRYTRPASAHMDADIAAGSSSPSDVRPTSGQTLILFLSDNRRAEGLKPSKTDYEGKQARPDLGDNLRCAGWKGDLYGAAFRVPPSFSPWRDKLKPAGV